MRQGHNYSLCRVNAVSKRNCIKACFLCSSFCVCGSENLIQLPLEGKNSVSCVGIWVWTAACRTASAFLQFLVEA